MRSTVRFAIIVGVLLASASASAALPMIEDDFGRARAEATARKLPLFVEVWAPW